MSEKPAQDPVAQRRSRSRAMIALGVILFVWAGVIAAVGDGRSPAAVILFGLLAVGLIVGGLVIRP